MASISPKTGRKNDKSCSLIWLDNYSGQEKNKQNKSRVSFIQISKMLIV